MIELLAYFERNATFWMAVLATLVIVLAAALLALEWVDAQIEKAIGCAADREELSDYRKAEEAAGPRAKEPPQ